MMNVCRWRILVALDVIRMDIGGHGPPGVESQSGPSSRSAGVARRPTRRQPTTRAATFEYLPELRALGFYRERMGSGWHWVAPDRSHAYREEDGHVLVMSSTSPDEDGVW